MPRQARSSRFISLGTKLVVLTGGVLLVISAVVFLELASRERQRLVQSKEEAAGMVADLVAVSLTAPLDFNEKDEIAATLEHLRSNKSVLYAAIWTSSSDAPIATFSRDETSSAPLRVRPQSPSAVVDGQVVETRGIVTPAGKDLGVVALCFSLEAEDALFEAARTRLLGFSLGLALITAAILTALTRRVVISPIARLVLAAQRLEKGQAASVASTANDEVGRLGDAFNEMAGAIVDRERRLANARARLQELVDHMRQGILVFGPGGVIEELASRQAMAIFGDRVGETSAGPSGIAALLYPTASEFDPEALAFKEWLNGVFELPASSWNELAALAPTEVTIARDGGAALELALEFRPIFEDPSREAESVSAKGPLKVARVMLLVTDETERKRLERTVQVQEQLHARQMEAMRRLMTGGAAMFATFVETANERLARSRELVEKLSGSQDVARVDELFQHLHTLKGEARNFNIADLEAEIANAEDAIDELRRDLRRADVGSLERCAKAIRTHLDAMAGIVTRARDTFVEASPVGGSVLDQITVPRPLLQQVETMVSGRDDELAKHIRRLAARPFGELTASILDGMGSWAARQRKKLVLEVRGKEIPIGTSEAKILHGALTNLLRNAVAHGIEPAEVREAAGKPGIGRITVECADEVGRLRISVEDDGAGLDPDALRARAKEVGLSTELGAAELAMSPGLSTVGVGEMAGRGMGLSAVQASLREIGWSVAITSEHGHGTRIVLSSPGSS